jgi:hypothetical protein
MKKHFRIKITNAKNTRSQDIELSSFIIGRGDEADFRLNIPGISRAHLSVEYREDKIFVTDLGSSNGTLLSGQKMVADEPMVYKEGELVVIGHEKTSLQFSLIGIQKEVPSEGLPPIPTDISFKNPVTKSVTGLTINNAPTKVTPKEVIPPIPSLPPIQMVSQDTVIDPHFQRVMQAPDQSIEEVKATLLKLKVSATTEAAKITQEAKERARLEIIKAQEKADEILEKASEQAGSLQRKSEEEAAELQAAMQSAIATVHKEMEGRAEAARRENREKGDAIIAEYTAKGEKILSAARVNATTIKGEAQRDAEAIIGSVTQRAKEIRNSIEEENKTLQGEGAAKAAEILSNAQSEADQVLTEARNASALIRKNSEIELAANRKHFDEEVGKIKEQAQIEAADIIALNQQLGDKQKQQLEELRAETEKELAAARALVQEEITKIKEDEEKECRLILARARRDAKSQKEELEELREAAEQEIVAIKLLAQQQCEDLKSAAQIEANSIIRNGEKEADKNLEEIEKIKNQVKVDAAEIRIKANNDAKELVDNTKTEVNIEKARLLEKATKEAEDFKAQEIQKVEEIRSAILKKTEEEKQKILRSIVSLEKDFDQIQSKIKEINLVNAQVILENQNYQAESEKHKKTLEVTKAKSEVELASLKSQLDSTKLLLENQKSEFDKVLQETQQIRDEVATAHQTLNQSRTEKEKIIADTLLLKKKEEEAKKQVDVQIQQNVAEKVRLRSMVEVEVQIFKEQAMNEVKVLREKAQADFEQKKKDQDSELVRLRTTELEIIKNLRNTEENEFFSARKNHTLEISKALETYLVSRVKEGLGTKELPKSFSNFFPEIKGIVGSVLESQYPESSSPNKVSSSKNRLKNNIGLIAGSACLLLIFLAFIPFGGENSNRKPASEIFLDHLRPKEKAQFNPQMTESYKPTYTENVLYTRDYVTFKLDSDRQAKWIKDLNKYFIDDLHLNENTIVKFISIESSLITQLKDMRAAVHVANQKDDISKMTSLEKNTLPEIIEVLGSEQKYKSFRSFEQKYFEKNRLPASE